MLGLGQPAETETDLVECGGRATGAEQKRSGHHCKPADAGGLG
jgi:hypothetical protein